MACSNVLQCVAPHMGCDISRHSQIQRFKLSWSFSCISLQHIAKLFFFAKTMFVQDHNALQRTATHCTATHCNALHCIAPHCAVLKCTATHCCALPRTATKCRSATQCNVVLHSSTHCNALPRTATQGYVAAFGRATGIIIYVTFAARNICLATANRSWVKNTIKRNKTNDKFAPQDSLTKTK